jgi:cytochrome c-type biogenesis protein CcmH
VMDFLVARYGEFVLLKPRFESHTWLLWLVPPLALMGGGLTLWINGRRRYSLAAPRDDASAALSADEEARLQKLMASEASPDAPL